jgi:hypothetical protein
MSYNFSNPNSNPNKESNTDLQQNPWTQTPQVGQPSSIAQQDTPTYTYAIKRIPGVVQGANSRMRDGRIVLDREGILVEGQAVLPPVYQWLILAGIVVGIGWILVALFLEYYRQPRREEIGWHEITEIVTESEKKRICFVYPDRDNPQKMCSLAMQYDEATFTNISQASRYYAGTKVHTGKIKRPDIIGLFVLLAVCVVIFTAIAIAANQQ